MRRQYISRLNITDINFIVVNAGDWRSRMYYYRLYKLGYYDLYQDYSSHTDQEDNVWNALNGEKDDFLIYDRCGQLTYHIPLPYSALKYPFIQIAIESTYTGRHPCNCSADDALNEGQTTTAMPVAEESNIGPAYNVSGGDQGDNHNGTSLVEFGGQQEIELTAAATMATTSAQPNAL